MVVDAVEVHPDISQYHQQIESTTALKYQISQLARVYNKWQGTGRLCRMVQDQRKITIMVVRASSYTQIFHGSTITPTPNPTP